MLYQLVTTNLGFPSSSACEESTCNAGDSSSIPGWGRPLKKGSSPVFLGFLLQYSWASLVTQMVNKLPAMWEAWVQTLGWEDLLEKGMATYSSNLAWRIPMDRRAWWVKVYGVANSWT